VNVGDLVVSRAFGRTRRGGIIVETFPHGAFEDAVRVWFFCSRGGYLVWPEDQLHKLKVISESR
jgi:hypothetical protein